MKIKTLFLALFSTLLSIGCSEVYYGGSDNNNIQEPEDNICITPKMVEKLWGEVENGLVESPAADIINCSLEGVRYEYVFEITYTGGGTGNTIERYLKVLQKRCEYFQLYNLDLNVDGSCLDFIVPQTIAIYYSNDLDVYIEIWANKDDGNTGPQGRRSQKISVDDDF